MALSGGGRGGGKGGEGGAGGGFEGVRVGGEDVVDGGVVVGFLC